MRNYAANSTSRLNNEINASIFYGGHMDTYFDRLCHHGSFEDASRKQEECAWPNESYLNLHDYVLPEIGIVKVKIGVKISEVVICDNCCALSLLLIRYLIKITFQMVGN